MVTEAKNLDATLVYGVNHGDFDPARHRIISNASCTTNCLAPVAKVVHDNFGIEYGLMTTCHSYTIDQHTYWTATRSDMRHARAACLPMIPTSTGAARAVTEVMPSLAGRLDGLSVRVPTPNVSLVDLVATLTRSASREAVNQAFTKAQEGALKGDSGRILRAAGVHGLQRRRLLRRGGCRNLTHVMGGTLVKVMAWYDNEMGFSNRMLDLAMYVGGQRFNL